MSHKHLLFRSEAREKTLLCQHWPFGGRESDGHDGEQRNDREPGEQPEQATPRAVALAEVKDDPSKCRGRGRDRDYASRATCGCRRRRPVSETVLA